MKRYAFLLLGLFLPFVSFNAVGQATYEVAVPVNKSLSRNLQVAITKNQQPFGTLSWSKGEIVFPKTKFSKFGNGYTLTKLDTQAATHTTDYRLASVTDGSGNKIAYRVRQGTNRAKWLQNNEVLAESGIAIKKGEVRLRVVVPENTPPYLIDLALLERFMQARKIVSSSFSFLPF